ncbi:MAG: ABC transporter ATP-binding protein [Nitrospirota bacterium]
MTPPTAPPVFHLDRVTVAYGADAALHEITLDIAAHAMTAVIGPNGSGKSTVLRVLAGLITPDTGTVTFDGTPLASMTPRERARRIAYVPQDTTVPFDFSVREIVAMGRSPYLSAWGFESPDDLAAIEQSIHLMDLRSLVDRSILDVSGGERQRAIIARALAQRPSVLLLDEPGANLDLHYQIALHALLTRMNREHGLTTVTVSHDLNAVADSDHVIALANGRIRATGPPAAVLTEAVIADVFNCRALIDVHPRTGRPRVTVEWTA